MFLVTGRKEDVMQAKKEIMSAADHFTQIRVNRKTPNNSGGGRNDAKNDNGESSNDCEKFKEASKSRKEGKVEKIPLMKCLHEKTSPNDVHKTSCNSKNDSRSVSNGGDCGYYSNGGSLKSSDSSFDSMSLSPFANSCTTVSPTTHTTISTFTTTSEEADLKSNHIWAKDFTLTDKQNYSTKANNFYNNMATNSKSNKTNSKNTPTLLQQHQITREVRVPFKVVGLVVGPKGATIKRIQESTHTYIVTPGRDRDPVFEIIGCPENVQKAKKEIESYISLRTKSSFSSSSENSPSFCDAGKSLISGNGGGNFFGENEVSSMDGTYNYSNYMYTGMEGKLGVDGNYEDISGENYNYLKLGDYNYQPFTKMVNIVTNVNNNPCNNNEMNDIKPYVNEGLLNKNLTNDLVYNPEYSNNPSTNNENINYNNSTDNKILTSKFNDYVSYNYTQFYNNTHNYKGNNPHINSDPIDTTISQILSSLSTETQDSSCYKSFIDNLPNNTSTTLYNDINNTNNNMEDTSNNGYNSNKYYYYSANSSSVNECAKDI